MIHLRLSDLANLCNKLEDKYQEDLPIYLAYPGGPRPLPRNAFDLGLIAKLSKDNLWPDCILLCPSFEEDTCDN